MIVLLIVGLAILLALALIVVLLLRNPTASAQPSLATGSASLTPSASASSAVSSPAATLSPSSARSTTASTKTATATATATKSTATATGPQVQTFAIVPQSAISGTTVTCTKAENLQVDFSWATSGATTVDFGVATMDASAAPYITGLPASGSLGSARAVVFQCYADSSEHTQLYTLTILSPGQKVSRTITLKEKYVP